MPKRLKLSPRLQEAANQVRPGSVAADVGTDHGYLACYLAAEGISPKAFASDLNPGPLSHAEEEICKNGLQGKVVPVLSDGVQKLPLEEIDDIIIAGMGGDLILSIISDPRLCDSHYRLILQPMTKANVLRRGLYRLGFELLQETAVRDGRFIYTVMTAFYCGEKREIDNCFAQVGLVDLRSGRAAKEYFGRVLVRLESRLEGLRCAGADNMELHELEELIETIKERMKHDDGA